MKILTVIGARPQFIKAAPVCHALRSSGHTEFLIHTGQHYDYQMSQIFFDELKIPQPNINLEIGSGLHSEQTGRMLIGLEKIYQEQNPDWVLVYGDTNSTLAGALAAVKLQIPLAHIEAGLRSFNRSMPEEHNRVLTDHCADLLFCPTQTAVDLLAKEGIIRNVHLIGDTMYDAILRFGDLAYSQSKILDELHISPKQYLLATIHRPYNTDNPENLRCILEAFASLETPIIFPIHPRTRHKVLELMASNTFPSIGPNIRMIEPIGFLDMLMLEKNAQFILTDSGGIQKEAYFLGVPCVTLRPETEWVETVQSGWNLLTGIVPEKIFAAIKKHVWPSSSPPPIFGNGSASKQIVEILGQVT